MKKFIIVFFLCSLMGLTMARGAENKNTALWWGCDFVELNFSGKTILLDPFGNISRKANVVLVTHANSDHCHVSSLNKIVAASSQKADLLIGSKECKGYFNRVSGIRKYLADRWENINYNGLMIQTVPSFEGLTDNSYILRDPKTKLNVMHMGDNNRYTQDFKKLSNIDYLFLAMGKMSFEDMILLIKDIKPKFLVPIHYKPRNGNILQARYDFPSPADPDKYIATLEQKIQDEKLATKIMVLKPGEEIELVSQKSKRGL